MPVAGMIPVYYIPTGATPSMTATSPAYSQNAVHVGGGGIAPNEHPGPPSPLLMGGNTFMPQGKLSMGSNIDEFILRVGIPIFLFLFLFYSFIPKKNLFLNSFFLFIAFFWFCQVCHVFANQKIIVTCKILDLTYPSAIVFCFSF